MKRFIFAATLLTGVITSTPARTQEVPLVASYPMEPDAATPLSSPLGKEE